QVLLVTTIESPSIHFEYVGPVVRVEREHAAIDRRRSRRLHRRGGSDRRPCRPLRRRDELRVGLLAGEGLGRERCPQRGRVRYAELLLETIAGEPARAGGHPPKLRL